MRYPGELVTNDGKVGNRILVNPLGEWIVTGPFTHLDFDQFVFIVAAEYEPTSMQCLYAIAPNGLVAMYARDCEWVPP
jgi:hypothetical protein